MKFDLKVNGLERLQKQIDYVKKLQSMVKDKNFQAFIQDKCLKTVKEITLQRIGDTTNADSIGLYLSNHKIEETNNGFILYNDTTIPANTKHPENYPNGEFNIALAFEYGVGIIGEYFTDNPNAWEYNVNNYVDGWHYPIGNDEYEFTQGYEGFEIYRFTAIEIQKQLPNWVREYFKS